MINPFADATRPAGVEPLTWRTWTALVLLPVLVMGLFLWAFWSPQTNHGAARAAVVNNDQPVTINGQTIPLGRQLASSLINTPSAYSWVLTDADDARDGLARGDYGAAVTIPADFSAKATSAATPNALNAGQAELRVQTSNASGVADPLITTQIAQVVLGTLNRQIVQTYLNNVYLSFNTIHDQLDQAAEGAQRLAAGADDLHNGATRLSAGSQQLAGGLSDAQSRVAAARKQVTAALGPALNRLPPPQPDGPLSQIERLATGLDEAASGATQVNDGTHQLNTGLGQLSAGAHDLAAQLAQGRDKIPTYNEHERDTLSNVAAAPAVALTDNTDLGGAVAAVAVTLALWVCGLATYLATRALPGAVISSRESTRRIVLRAILPGTTVAAVTAVALGLLMIPILHLPARNWCALMGVIILTALTFLALNQALTAVLYRAGRFVCIAVLVLAVVTTLTATIPPTLHTIGNYLPTHAAILVLRGVIVDSNTAVGGSLELLVWLLMALVSTVLATEYRRTLRGKQLRLGHTDVISAYS